MNWGDNGSAGARYTSLMNPSAVDIALNCSPFLAEWVRRNPEGWAELKASGRLETGSGPAAKHLAQQIESCGLDPALRRYRNAEMVRIIWRDLNEAAELEETLADLTRLAEVCLQAALEEHHQLLSNRYGAPLDADENPMRLVVIGLGKLGGGELNLSSDIDIMFSYPRAGICDGPRSLPGEQFFLRLARNTIRSLSEVTEDGFCFRVDTRLRPFGESGPLVCSFGAMEQYYQREGRDWERYALVKARPVAGDRAAGEALMSILRPFVYRRYIDFGAVEALQEMHASVRQDAAHRGREQDIKRGAGGIREIEFMVQAYQLLRGGREPRLQTPSIYEAMETLDRLKVLASQTIEDLRAQYGFLRRLENRIQALHDQQTHQLPAGEDLHRVATAMRFESVDTLQAELQKVRRAVSALFLEHLQPRRPDQESAHLATQAEGHWQAQWRKLALGGDGPPDGTHPVMARFLERLNRQSMSQRASRRLHAFMPILLQQLEGRAIADDTLTDVLELILGVTRRSAYLSLLTHNPLACRRMLDLFEESDWVAGTVIRHPALLDELLDPTLGRLLPGRSELDETGHRILDSHDDVEEALQALNYFKQATSLRVAVAEIETSLSAEEVQHTLTGLAETLLNICLRLADREVRDKHQSPPRSELCVIGYGSLGARELGYGSDLDLIFLFDGDAASPGQDESFISPERFHTRVARKLISLLTIPTVSGRLYETDTRLRPNGRSGLLVSSISAFEKYQREKAWTWELQSLTRARALAGSRDVERRFRAVRKEVLGRAHETDTLRAEITQMRKKMRAEFQGGDRFKHGPGGLVDIDFLTQLGILESAGHSPEVLEHNGTRDQLLALATAGWISQSEAETLCETRESLCHARHLTSIARNPGRYQPETREAVDICRRLLGDLADDWFSIGSGPDDRLNNDPPDGISR